ncbi:MAG: aldo/keto reductase [Aigarchaeota archaeon]|nr:aldo/keto reductase [Candidatus Pelearchaeum maunauluense]
MLYSQLGTTGLRISQIGVGTWQFGDKWWGWGRGYGEEEAITAIKEAVAHGVNFIDTAEIYGKGISEQVVGKAIRNIREQVVIATKVWPTHATYNGVIKACERSLKRLRIKMIDLYQVHWPNPIVPIGQTMRAMERLVREGKISYIGVSNFSLKQLIKAQEALKSEQVVSNQVKYNIVERDVERELLPYAEREKITIIAYSPLAQGLLTGKYDPNNLPRDAVRKINILFDKNNITKLQSLITMLREIADKYERTPAQVALNWLIKKPEVVAIAGVKNPQQARDNAGAGEFKLAGEDIERITKIADEIRIDKTLSRLKVFLRLLR